MARDVALAYTKVIHEAQALLENPARTPAERDTLQHEIDRLTADSAKALAELGSQRDKALEECARSTAKNPAATLCGRALLTGVVVVVEPGPADDGVAEIRVASQAVVSARAGALEITDAGAAPRALSLRNGAETFVVDGAGVLLQRARTRAARARRESLLIVLEGHPGVVVLKTSKRLTREQRIFAEASGFEIAANAADVRALACAQH